MIKVAYLTNSSARSGVGSQAEELKQKLLANSSVHLRNFHMDGNKLLGDGEVLKHIKPWPGLLGSKSVNWIRLGKALPSYIHEEELVHATNQTLSFIKVNKPMVVTIHDLIELLEPQNRRGYLINKYLYSGIERAGRLIAVSEYTKQTIIDYYGLSGEKIDVIYNGVNPELFHPIENFNQTVGYQTLRQDLRLGDRQPVILYVGSDHPRKNLPGTLRAFKKLKKQQPQAIFLKVGQPGLLSGRATTLAEVDRLKLKDSVRFINSVSDKRLNELYNLADVFVFLSEFEGFGLPPLQAMAVGLPVVCSNSTSLPEVVGRAALTHESNDIEGITQSLLQVTQDLQLKQKLKQAGLEQAQKFSWQQAAQATFDTYRKVSYNAK